MSLSLLHLAATEEYSYLKDEWLKSGDGFMLSYRIISRATFDELPGLWESLLKIHQTDKVPAVLIGCMVRIGVRSVNSANLLFSAMSRRCAKYQQRTEKPWLPLGESPSSRYQPKQVSNMFTFDADESLQI